MPRQIPRFTRAEQEEYRKRLRSLQEMGVPAGCVRESSPKPNPFTLTQVWHDLAGVFELPSGGIAVVMYATLVVLKPGAMSSDSGLVVPWDDFALELDDCEATPYFKEVLQGSPYWPPTILNRWLTGELPLSRGRRDGVIVATGWSEVPARVHDETPVSVKLYVADEQDEELCFEFRARMDRSLKRKYERQWQERLQALRSTKRTGLFGPAKTETRGQVRTTQERDGSPISPSRVVVSTNKPTEVSPPLISHESRRTNRLQREGPRSRLQ
jgi:hypothetical protein